MTSTPQKTALVIGVTGSFGGHAAVALMQRGWRIRAMSRDPQAAAARAGARMPIEWVKGDAMNAADVAAAARGASVIVHAANPPKYHNWNGLVRQMLASTIEAAKAERALIVYPGSVYNFAPDAGPHIAEDAPQAPATRKGALRVEMEAMLRQASGEGARVVVVRGGDYFGPAAPNSALGWLTLRRAGRLTAVFVPGPVGVGHAFAYLPDLARVAASLVERRDELAPFEVFHFAGHWLARGDELLAGLRRASGQPRLTALPFPWPVVIALSPFVEMFSELLEMRYLWRRPIGLDDAKLRAFLGEVPATPLDVALRATLADMGCLAQAGAPDGALAAA
jgi:nucleoside-diphosphate-sugar epimerase